MNRMKPKHENHHHKDNDYNYYNSGQLRSPLAKAASVAVLLAIANLSVSFFIMANNQRGNMTVDFKDRHSQKEHTHPSSHGEHDDDSHLQCLSFDSPSFEELLLESDPLYILMPAKAGGTTLKEFATRCSGATPASNTKTTASSFYDNFLNRDHKLQPFLTSKLTPPRIIASHLYFPKPLLDLIRFSARTSLIMYVYRDETERLLSAIKYEVKRLLCDPTGLETLKWATDKNITKEKFRLELTQDSCTFDEQPFVSKLIASSFDSEIAFSIPSQLTCPVWNAIEDNNPNIIFVHYTELDALQAKLASIFCPDVSLVRKNDDREVSSTMTYQVRLAKGGDGQKGPNIIPVDEWVQAKKSILEYTLKLSGSSCKKKIRKMEDVLYSCPNNMALKVFPYHSWL